MLLIFAGLVLVPNNTENVQTNNERLSPQSTQIGALFLGVIIGLISFGYTVSGWAEEKEKKTDDKK